MTGARSNLGWWFRLWADGPGLICLYRNFKPLYTERSGARRFYPAWPARWRFRLVWGRS